MKRENILLQRFYIDRNANRLTDHQCISVVVRPNLSRYRNHVDQESREAIIQLVDTKELYALQNNGRVPTVEELLNEGYIKREHAEIYQRP